MGILVLLINVLIWIIIIDAILSWIPSVDRRSPLVVGIKTITTPILAPIRRLVPPERTGYIDLSPLIAIIGLHILSYILIGLIRYT